MYEQPELPFERGKRLPRTHDELVEERIKALHELEAKQFAVYLKNQKVNRPTQDHVRRFFLLDNPDEYRDPDELKIVVDRATEILRSH
jgi:hypothetical protein